MLDNIARTISALVVIGFLGITCIEIVTKGKLGRSKLFRNSKVRNLIAKVLQKLKK